MPMNSNEHSHITIHTIQYIDYHNVNTGLYKQLAGSCTDICRTRPVCRCRLHDQPGR